MPTATTIYALSKPTVGGDADVWGGYLNTDIDKLEALLGVITTGGSGAAYTLTSGLSLSSYVSGQSFLIKASFTCNAAATLNVDGLGAKNITKRGTVATVSGDVISGNIYRVSYDGVQFQIDGMLGTNFLVASNNLSDLGSVSTARTNLGLGTAATVNTGTSGATIPLLNGSNTFSGSTVFTTDVQLSYATPNLDLVGTGSNIVRLQFRNGSRYDDIRNTTAGMEFRVNTSGTPLSMLFTTGGGLQVQVAISAETTGTLTSASRNMMVHCTGNITLPASGMTDGDMILIDPRGTARTISRPAAHTMYVNDVDSATATSTARSLVVAKYNGSSSWSLSGI